MRNSNEYVTLCVCDTLYGKCVSDCVCAGMAVCVSDCVCAYGRTKQHSVTLIWKFLFMDSSPQM